MSVPCSDTLYFWHQLPYAVPGFVTFLVGAWLASFAFYASLTRAARRTEYLALGVMCTGYAGLGLVLGLRAIVLDRVLLLHLHDYFYPPALLLAPGTTLLAYSLARRRKRLWGGLSIIAAVTVLLGWAAFATGRAFLPTGGHAFVFGFYPAGGRLLLPWGIWGAFGAVLLIASLPDLLHTSPGRRLLAAGLVLAAALTSLNLPALAGYPLFPPAAFGFIPICMVAYGVFRDDFLDLNDLLVAKRGIYFLLCGLLACVFGALAVLVATRLSPSSLDTLSWKGWPAIPLVSSLSVFSLGIFVSGSNPRRRLNLLAGGTFFCIGVYALIGVVRALPLEPIVALRLEQLCYIGFAFFGSVGNRFVLAAFEVAVPRWFRVVDVASLAVSILALTPLLLRGYYLFDFARVSASGPAATTFYAFGMASLGATLLHLRRSDRKGEGAYAAGAVVLSAILIFLSIPATRGVRFYSFGNLQILPALLATFGVLRAGGLGVRTEVTRVARRLTLVAMVPLAIFAVVAHALTTASTSPSGRLLYGALVIAPIALLVFLLLFVFSQPIAERLEEETRRREEETRRRELETAAAAARAAEEKNAALARMDQLKDEFLANTSHELRTPLHAIVGLAESLADNEHAKTDRSLGEALAMIAKSGKRLGKLVGDILDFAQLRHGQLALSRRAVDVRSAVSVALALVASLVGKKRITLENAVPPATPWVTADEDRLQQILVNLLGNAVKFTREGSVRVTAEQKATDVAVTVEDTGIGIAEAHLGRLFEAFEQGDGSTAREHGGTGIGLAITKRLVELHGGALSVASTQDRGTLVTFTVPISDKQSDTLAGPTRSAAGRLGADDREPSSRAFDSIGADAPVLTDPEEPLHGSLRAMTVRPGPGHATTASSAKSDNATWRVLAVDDDDVNLTLLGTLLLRSEYQVTTARSGQEALDLIETGARFDAVLLDVMMPKMTGYEACRRIRERFARNELPVLLLTAKSRIEDLVEGFEAGANDYLVKPFSKNELLARLQTHVSLAKTHAAYARFVPEEFLKLLGRDDVTSVVLGDRVERELTVLFCDVRGFTATTEGMNPEQAFRFISEIFYAFSPLIRRHGGFIDKYIGDAVMALFPTSPEGALNAAVAMVRAARSLGGALGTDDVKVGIGIHTGQVILGTLGDEQRMDATVISDAVNLASRIEGLTKPFGVAILVSERTLEGIENVNRLAARRMGQVRVRGKERPVAVFEVTGGDATGMRNLKLEHNERFVVAVELFESGQLAEAKGMFIELLHADPGDGPARFYREQCERYERRPGEREPVLTIG